MNTINPGASALVLVDYQRRLMPALHEGEAVVARAVWLADVARWLHIRVIGTEENPQGLGPNVEAIRSRCEVTVAKTHFDACVDGLLDALRVGGHLPADVVIAGCEAHVCLLQTALGLLRHGTRAWVVADACASRRAGDRELALQRLRGAGAVLVSTEMVAFEWLRSSEHPRFKDLLPLLKRGPGV
jgi:nicotinamidase-related amidase